jgi:hypothetical protein
MALTRGPHWSAGGGERGGGAGCAGLRRCWAAGRRERSAACSALRAKKKKENGPGKRGWLG